MLKRISEPFTCCRLCSLRSCDCSEDSPCQNFEQPQRIKGIYKTYESLSRDLLESDNPRELKDYFRRYKIPLDKDV